MTRHSGSVLDLRTRTVRGRDGVVCPLDRVELAGAGLHVTRHVAENPRIDYLEAWLLPEKGWAIGRFLFGGRALEPEWYMETEIIEVDGDTWAVHDGLLDFFVFEGERYELQDLDELANAVANGEIPLEDAVRVLRSAHNLAEALAQNGFSGAALLRSHGFSPRELPRP